MTRIRILDGGIRHHAELNDGSSQKSFVGYYFIPSVRRHRYIYGADEVEVIPPAHRGEYNPEHFGEKYPDYYDRMGYDSGHGRHLLDSGVN
jgi:hypothetical protein